MGILVETAPNDGAWGVAMNSSSFFSNANPEHFTLDSEAPDTLRFEVNGRVFDRAHRESNALGKSLMIARDMLRYRMSVQAEVQVAELRETVLEVCEHMQRMALGFDWT